MLFTCSSSALAEMSMTCSTENRIPSRRPILILHVGHAQYVPPNFIYRCTVPRLFALRCPRTVLEEMSTLGGYASSLLISCTHPGAGTLTACGGTAGANQDQS